MYNLYNHLKKKKFAINVNNNINNSLFVWFNYAQIYTLKTNLSNQSCYRLLFNLMV